MSRRAAFLKTQKAPVAIRCPHCNDRLGAITGVSLDSPPPGGETMQIKGGVTICYSCGGLLQFIDNVGHVRILPAEELRTMNLDPTVFTLVATLQKGAAARNRERRGIQ